MDDLSFTKLLNPIYEKSLKCLILKALRDFLYLWFNSLTEKADKTHTHDDRYYTETEINTKINPLYNIGTGSTVGKIYRYNDSAHTVGITWKEYSTSYAPVPRFVFDGNQTFDVIPNNPGTNNYKIINCWASVQNGGAFRLNFVIYIDGTYYTRYINLSY